MWQDLGVVNEGGSNVCCQVGTTLCVGKEQKQKAETCLLTLTKRGHQ